MYEWAELIKLWEHERLTMEQVIGQLLRYSEQSYNANVDMQRALEKLAAAHHDVGSWPGETQRGLSTTGATVPSSWMVCSSEWIPFIFRFSVRRII